MSSDLDEISANRCGRLVREAIDVQEEAISSSWMPTKRKRISFNKLLRETEYPEYRTATDVAVGSEVGESNGRFSSERLTSLRFDRIYFSLYTPLPLFSLPRTASLADHSIKSIWDWRRALHARRIDVAFARRRIGSDRNRGNPSPRLR